VLVGSHRDSLLQVPGSECNECITIRPAKSQTLANDMTSCFVILEVVLEGCERGDQCEGFEINQKDHQVE
jgi:hypothetical protein